jgi:hypothetical protein
VSPDEIKQYQKQRRERFTTAKKILPGHRSLQGCGCRLIDGKGGVTVMHAPSQLGGNVRYAGAASCGSVWICPHCAPSVTEQRALEIQRAVELWTHRVGDYFGTWKTNDVAMLTLTAPHDANQSLCDLLEMFRESQAVLRASSAWKTAVRKLRCIGVIRALEVTYGFTNGWHPHVHLILFLRDGIDQEQVAARLDAFASAIYPEWRDACTGAGLRAPSRQRGVNIVHGESVSEKLAAYVSKFGRDPKGAWGIEREIAKNHTKTAKSGHDGSERYHPFGLLDEYARTGDDRFRRLFLEYATAFKGERQLVWQRSKSFKDALAEFGFVRDSERTDEELAQAQADQSAPEETQVAEISREDWFALCRFDLVERLRTALLAIPSAATVAHYVERARALASERRRVFEQRLRPPPNDTQAA